MHAPMEPLWIGPLAWEDRGKVLEWLGEEIPPEACSVLEGDIPPESPLRWIFRGAYRGTHLLGVEMACMQPGRTAVIWPPRFLLPQGAEVGLALVEGVCQELAVQGTSLVYCFLEVGSGPESRLMQIAGFFHLAQLLYLVSMEEDFPSQSPPSPLCFEPYCPQNHFRLLRTIEATYQESLDCPILNQRRAVEDVLAGYRATGVHRPELWQIVRAGPEDVGCLLLTDQPELESLELIYMGLVPSVRGRGWGVELARQAQWLTQLAGRRQLLLAVDANNWPAIRVYGAVGFRQWAERIVYGRFLASSCWPKGEGLSADSRPSGGAGANF